ncbi:MAG: hypothetical protein IJO43_01190 [Bacilli bacterium]|nr:hypothetical protein [Bacilli bacterium]
MNSLKKIKDNFSFKINECSFNNNVRFINTDKGRFVVKKNKHNNANLFRYLRTKNFHNFLELYDYSDEYEVYQYVNNVPVTIEEKALDIVNLITMLHNKTTFYKSSDIDKFQEIYEDINNKLAYLNNYYQNIRMIIEEEKYTSPSGYLFLRNLSVIHRSIDESKYFIDKWYELVKTKENFRVATIHNYLELDHLIKGDVTYLISWDKSCKASPIYDIMSLYKETYDKVDFYSLFELYNSKYPLYEEELYLLFSLLLVPSKLEFIKREIVNTKDVYELNNYLISTINFISKYQSDNTNAKTN